MTIIYSLFLGENLVYSCFLWQGGGKEGRKEGKEKERKEKEERQKI
jgi:hypothetical protein